jgi:uncharacterized phiE125 gp8 family phage protein
VDTYALTVTSAPTGEVLAQADVKRHLRVDHLDDDVLIDSLIIAARQYVEQGYNRALLPQTLAMKLDSFPLRTNVIYIPRAPLTAVTSITYFDVANISRTLAATNYDVDVDSYRGRVSLAFANFWPPTYYRPNAVTVNFTAGYADAASVPAPIKQAMLLLISDMYENRGSIVTGTTSSQIELTVRHLMGMFTVF